MRTGTSSDPDPRSARTATSLSGLAAFAAVYLVAVALPGPGIAALVARVPACRMAGVAGFAAVFRRRRPRLVLSAVLGAYVLAASRARRAIDRGAGTVRAGAAIAIVTR